MSSPTCLTVLTHHLATRTWKGLYHNMFATTTTTSAIQENHITIKPLNKLGARYVSESSIDLIRDKCVDL